ncbi:MAG: hypothetical protein Q4G09_06740, partial [Clostridia bacterium]|nr:hypothetical protein [Clostridia bacterium]
YTRNKIRNIVIPYIKKEFNPNIFKTINRLSEVVIQENEYLNKITKKIFKEILIVNTAKGKSFLEDNIQTKTNQIIIDLKKFNELELVIKRRIILYIVNELLSSTKGMEKINIDDIIKLCKNNIGNKYLMPTKKLKVSLKKGKIFFDAM